VRDGWLAAGCTLLLFCLLEGGLSLAFFVKDRLSAPAPDQRAVADTYSDPTWVNNYQEEFNRSKVAQWRPYVYWRRMPYRGSYINVDADGIRLTASTEVAGTESRTPLKVFMFGGSTMWGTGARDAYTIPSVVERELRQRGVAAEVVNFGESGYVSTQEVITLLLQLQKGRLPDIVIFYDGVNDLYSAYQQRTAGLPQNEFNREREFDLSQPDKFRQRTSIDLRDAATKSSTVRLANGLLRKAGVRRATTASDYSPLDSPAPESEALARDVIAAYKGNMEVVKALGEHYHFKYFFYWQPTIFQKTRLTAYEAGQQAQAQDLGRFVGLTYAAMRQSGLADARENSFRDLSLIFADAGEPLYIDWCHLGESGNEVVAKSMASDILDLTAGR
ncbi:MAG: SGNH/GDSL hydrolase family protein, partial [Acidobacteriota bacterium]|nr:SGNH/GDSL hydrolase family protein [Acidobacteriota bacterium]